MKDLSRKIRAELEKIVAENWPVDGPFVTTIEELTGKVCSEVGVSRGFWVALFGVVGDSWLEIIDRRDREEILRLVIRMYLAGVLAGGGLGA